MSSGEYSFGSHVTGELGKAASVVGNFLIKGITVRTE